MFILANLLSATAGVLDWVLVGLEWVIIIWVLLSWANADPYNALVRAIQAISEPFLKPFRKILPPWKLSGVDLSPVFAILTIEFVKRFLVASLWDIASRLK